MPAWSLVVNGEKTQWLSWLAQEYGNLASLLGLVISILALVLTALTFRRAGEAKRYAQQAVNRVGSRILSRELARLSHFVRLAREAGAANQWTRIFDRCHDARELAAPLAMDDRLNENEREDISKILNDLRLVAQHVENEKMPPGSSTDPISNQKKKFLDDMITTLGAIQARLLNEEMEVTNVE